MTQHWDEFSKSLSEAVPRRQSLRLLGAALAGAVFSQLGLRTTWGAKQDPCKTFCARCSNKTQQNQCLAACQACNGNTSRLAGSCGGYVCCQTAACNGVCSNLRSSPNCGACGNDCRVYGETCCGNYCADLKNDFDNCGSCGFRCDDPGPHVYGECVEGACVYDCVPGAILCDGACTAVDSDPDNCGACGNVCSEPTPYCSNGTCIPADEPCPGGGTRCNGICTNISFDTLNCGGCGIVCGAGETCFGGVCQLPF